MGEAELLIVGVLVAVAGLSALALRLSIPYPIVLVIGGALFGFIPGVPELHLDPDVVLVVFLPPLLYGAAFFANFRDIRANARAIALSSVGLVLAIPHAPPRRARGQDRGRRLRGPLAGLPADDRRVISNDVMRRVVQELDLEESRLEIS
jgi:hypothetical protein